MGSTTYSKRKGQQTEQMVVDYLIERGYVNAERRRLNGIHDRGDIAGLPGLCIEVKGGAKLEIPAWLKQLEQETVNSFSDHGLLVVRRKGVRDPSEWFAIQKLGAWMDLYTELDGITTRD